MVLLSLHLSINLRYNHFYEFMLLGIFLFFVPLVPKGTMGERTYIMLYIMFILAGVVVDLFMGMMMANLWYYTYSSLIEYIVLYLMVYPIGGIVMVQNFLIFKNLFTSNAKKWAVINLKTLKILTVFFIIFSIILFATEMGLGTPYLASFFSIIFTAFLILNYIAERPAYLRGKKGISYIRILLESPKACILATLGTSYVHGIIHEVPNTFAMQWVYHGWPLKDFTILGLPGFGLLVGWVALTVVPVSAYYSQLKLRGQS